MASRLVKKTSKYWQLISKTGFKVNANIRPFSIPGYRLPTILKKRRYGATAKQVEHNLVSVNFLGHTIWVHRHIYHQLRRVERDIRTFEKKHKKRKYYPKVIETWCWRLVRGGRTLSNHSFGTAIDIDPAQNWMGTNNCNIPHYVITAFTNHRFRWGGNYRGRLDNMHFEG